MSDARRAILLSFDVEEFDLPLEYGGQIDPTRQLDIGGEGTRTALDLLREQGSRCTLFVTARFAEAFPELIRRAVADGHEIASHGLVHTGWEDAHLAASRGVLERIAGRAVTGFRRARLAPTDPKAVAAAGYRYNSSDNPTWVPGRYNHLLHPRRAYRLKLSDGSELVEIPASVTPLVRWPLFWLAFKNVPLWMTRTATRAALAADGYVALYFHPWELCDLSGMGLPGYIAGLDGPRYRARLGAYMAWLSGRGEWWTYAELASKIMDGTRPAGTRRLA